MYAYRCNFQVPALQSTPFKAARQYENKEEQLNAKLKEIYSVDLTDFECT